MKIGQDPYKNFSQDASNTYIAKKRATLYPQNTLTNNKNNTENK